MASIAHVLTDISALAGEVKRKHSDVRQAIDTAQRVSKTLAGTDKITKNSEIQTVFVAPFILALDSASSKLVSAALPPLIRLASSESLSAEHPAKIVDVLYNADTAACPVEMQLKTLQLLPVLVRGYPLESACFVRLVAISSRLASATNVVVANTASATLQQIFSSLFDNLRNRQDSGDGDRKDYSLSANSDDSSHSFRLDGLEARCFHVVCDLSSAISGRKLTLFSDRDIRFRAEAALEILENILALNRDLFERRAELRAVLQHKTIPGILEIFTSRTPQYALMLRSLRIVVILISCQIAEISEEIELLLASMNHTFLDDSAVSPSLDDISGSHSVTHPYWEKALVIESYKTVLSNFDIVRTLYHSFDGTKKKKGVLNEIFVVMNTFLGKGHSGLFRNKTIHAPSDKSSGPVLSRSTATLKTPMMDHLDRSEPPAGIPDLYAPFLIFRSLIGFADGVSEYVLGISANSDADTIEADVDFITSLNESVFSEVFKLFRKFLYASSDSETFHMIVRALQKYTHAIGLLGLASSRDELLKLLSNCIIQTTVEEEKRGNTSNLLALGESLVESITSTIQPQYASSSRQNSQTYGTSGDADLPSRTFNSRQLTCLRAFLNLAISLGSTLQDSWKLVWVTLQWVNFFVEGQEEHGTLSQSKDSQIPPDSKLGAHELAGIKQSQDKLLDSISEYQYDSFFEAFSAVAELYYEGEDSSKVQASTTQVCPFNKTFFLKMIVNLSTLETRSFLFIDSEIWAFTSNFFEKLATNRTLAHQKRIYIVKCWTFIIGNVTRKGFKAEIDTDVTAGKSLDALFGFLTRLLELGRAEELLILSCETEMHLSVLESVHSLIDDYDKYYVNSWDLVFKILKTAFVNTNDQSGQSSKLVEKIVMLISTSFDSLRMILDEFLATLPFNQLKSLMDTLLQFCSQKYDLNISFSSVSYFWQISDCIRSNMAQFENSETHALENVDNLEQLEELLYNATSGSPELYQALNIYLLAKLSHLSSDDRNQVREGVIQTLFQILDVQGTESPSWELIYHVVFPELLDLTSVESKSSSPSKNDTVSSLNLILSGLVSVFAKYMTDFERENNVREFFWKRFFSYMGSILKLKWNELNSSVFQSFQDILLPLREIQFIPKPMTRLLFDFWVSVPIDYDFVHPEYQESLAVFNQSFKDLYDLIKSDFGIAEANQVISVLNKCARYPVLKPGVNDTIKPTILQKIVVENLAYVDVKGPNEEVAASIIQQLTQIAAYPYEIRGRIEAKLKSKFDGRLKIPTFIAVGQFSFDCAKEKLAGLGDSKNLLREERLHRIMRDLLDIVRNKAQGVPAEENEPLWIRCNTLLFQLTNRLVEQNLKDFEEDGQVWEVLLECITVTFESTYDVEADVSQYERLSGLILPVLFQSSQSKLIETFIQKLYFNSYLYKADVTENELMNGGDDFEALTAYRFEDAFGTTAKLVTESNCAMRMKCLKELFRIASDDGFSAEVARKFVSTRAAFSIRRFVADGRLSGHRPLPQVQEDELLQILTGFTEMGHTLDPKQVDGLMTLFTQSLAHVDRVEGMKEALQEVFLLGIGRRSG